MSIVDFLLGRKQISVKNCVRDQRDPRVSICEVTIHESGGVARKGQITAIGDNQIVHPISKTGALTDEDFRDTIHFLNKGGWQKIVPSTGQTEEEKA